MKAARFYNQHDIRIETLPEPVPKRGEVLIDVEWAGICGSDLHEYLIGPQIIPSEKKGPHSITGETLPITLGHEFCGRISKAPANGKLRVGQPVMVDPRINCKTCHHCSSGSSNVCAQWGFLGLHAGGGFAEKVVVDERMCYPLPDSFSLADAALIEPLAVARHAISCSGIRDWSQLSCLVIGGGPVGFAVLCNLRAANAAQVFVSEPTAKRQEQIAHFANAVLNPLHVKVSAECQKLTNGHGVDAVFDCAGIMSGLRDGMAALRPHGTYVNVAGWETPMELPIYLCLIKEISIKFSMAYNDKDFSDVVDDFVAGKFKGAEQMITSRIALEDTVEKGFEALIKNKNEHIKILVTPKVELLESY